MNSKNDTKYFISSDKEAAEKVFNKYELSCGDDWKQLIQLTTGKVVSEDEAIRDEGY